MTSVRMTAAALSQLLSHVQRRGDGEEGSSMSSSMSSGDDVHEGVLFGVYRDSVRQVATDESDAAREATTHVDVEGCLMLGSHCTFYTPSGSIDLARLKALVARVALPATTVVGWFRCKANRAMTMPTVRELAVQRNLQAVNPLRPLLFASVASVVVAQSAVLDYRFLTMSWPTAGSLVVQPVPIAVVNLQQSSADAFAAVIDAPPVGQPVAAGGAALGLSPNVQRLQSASLAELKARVDRVQELAAATQKK